MQWSILPNIFCEDNTKYLQPYNDDDSSIYISSMTSRI
jgi:hypothetical protein